MKSREGGKEIEKEKERQRKYPWAPSAFPPPRPSSLRPYACLAFAVSKPQSRPKGLARAADWLSFMIHEGYNATWIKEWRVVVHGFHRRGAAGPRQVR